MQQIVIEIALPRDRKARASPDELLSPGIASLPGFKFLPEDSLEKQLLMEKFHNIIDLQGFTTNFFKDTLILMCIYVKCEELTDTI